MPEMTGAQALVRSLARNGVEVVFALPGVQIMDAFDAIYQEPGIRLITARHEQAVAYMADGYARTTGKPGVGLVVPGPGALNTTAALGTAYATSSPVLLVCGQIETYNLGKNRGALHEIGEQLDVFEHLTKWRHRAEAVDEIPEMVQTAFQHLGTGRPRPVEIEVPWDVLPSRATAELLEGEVYAKTPPEPAQVREAAQLLSQARRPVIWAGGGAREADLSDELLELARTLNAPVITTPQGKGAIPENDPLSVGCFYYAHGPGVLTLPQADVILAVGSRLLFSPNVPWAIQPHQETGADRRRPRRGGPQLRAGGGHGRRRPLGRPSAAGRAERPLPEQRMDLKPDRVHPPTVRPANPGDGPHPSGHNRSHSQRTGRRRHRGQRHHRHRLLESLGLPGAQAPFVSHVQLFRHLGLRLPDGPRRQGGQPPSPGHRHQRRRRLWLRRGRVGYGGPGRHQRGDAGVQQCDAGGVLPGAAQPAGRPDHRHRVAQPGLRPTGRGLRRYGHQAGQPRGSGDALKTALRAERPVVIEVPIPSMLPPFQIPPLTGQETSA